MTEPHVPVTDPQGRVVGHVIKQKQGPDTSVEITVEMTSEGRRLFEGTVLSIPGGPSRYVVAGDTLTYRIPAHELGPVCTFDWVHLVPNWLATAPERYEDERTGPCRCTDPHQPHPWSYVDVKGGGRIAMFCEGASRACPHSRRGDGMHYWTAASGSGRDMRCGWCGALGNPTEEGD